MYYINRDTGDKLDDDITQMKSYGNASLVSVDPILRAQCRVGKSGSNYKYSRLDIFKCCNTCFSQRHGISLVRGAYQNSYEAGTNYYFSFLVSNMNGQLACDDPKKNSDGSYPTDCPQVKGDGLDIPDVW